MSTNRRILISIIISLMDQSIFPQENFSALPCKIYSKPLNMAIFQMQYYKWILEYWALKLVIVNHIVGGENSNSFFWTPIFDQIVILCMVTGKCPRPPQWTKPIQVFRQKYQFLILAKVIVFQIQTQMPESKCAYPVRGTYLVCSPHIQHSYNGHLCPHTTRGGSNMEICLLGHTQIHRWRLHIYNLVAIAFGYLRLVRQV